MGAVRLENTIKSLRLLSWEERLARLGGHEKLTLQIFEHGIRAGVNAILSNGSFEMIVEDAPHAVKPHQVKSIYVANKHTLHVEIPGQLITAKDNTQRIQSIDFATDIHVLHAMVSMINIANAAGGTFDQNESMDNSTREISVRRGRIGIVPRIPYPKLEIGFKNFSYMEGLSYDRTHIQSLWYPLMMHPYYSDVVVLHSQAESKHINPENIFRSVYEILQRDPSLGTTIGHDNGSSYNDWIRHTSIRSVPQKLDNYPNRTMVPPDSKDGFNFYTRRTAEVGKEKEPFTSVHMGKIQWRLP